MPPVSKIALFSEADRAELDADIRSCAYAQIVEVTNRLKARGHQVGKSAVGVHALRLKEADQLEKEAATETGRRAALDRAKLRGLCLDVAHSNFPKAAGSDLTDVADLYVSWVFAD